jgi:hypothetical protein
LTEKYTMITHVLKIATLLTINRDLASRLIVRFYRDLIGDFLEIGNIDNFMGNSMQSCIFLLQSVTKSVHIRYQTFLGLYVLLLY